MKIVTEQTLSHLGRRANSVLRRELRREYAGERNEDRSTRSDEEQLALLDERPGNSTKERARLHANIDAKRQKIEAAKAKKQREKEAKEAKA